VVSRNLWNCIVGGIWKSLEVETREALECCKQSLMSDSDGSSENQNANKNVHSKDLCS
jgi:hypothetical protein